VTGGPDQSLNETAFIESRALLHVCVTIIQEMVPCPLPGWPGVQCPPEPMRMFFVSLRLNSDVLQLIEFNQVMEENRWAFVCGN